MKRIAIVHDWLVSFAGAEKVLEQIIDLYPNSDLFSVIDFLSDVDRNKIKGKFARTSFLQNFPRVSKNYRNYLPLMPFAIEQFDLSEYDLIISSSHAVAKGVITGPNQLHICYCHSPIRYAWDMQGQYLRESGLEKGFKGWLARYFLHKIRNWDSRTALGVDYFISNSNYIGKRIQKVYRRDSTTIYPNVSVDDFSVALHKEDFYLTASRMVPYKKIDLIVSAFSQMPEKKLVVIGDGPQFKKVSRAATKNITILGYQNFDVLKDHMERAKAFVFAAEEDFGIIPVEAQACGTPIIAFGKGGALETVIPGRTGVFFYQQTEDDIKEAVNKFDSGQGFDPLEIRRHAESFSTNRFKTEFKEFVDRKIYEFFGS